MAIPKNTFLVSLSLKPNTASLRRVPTVVINAVSSRSFPSSFAIPSVIRAKKPTTITAIEIKLIKPSTKAEVAAKSAPTPFITAEIPPETLAKAPVVAVVTAAEAAAFAVRAAVFAAIIGVFVATTALLALTAAP